MRRRRTRTGVNTGTTASAAIALKRARVMLLVAFVAAGSVAASSTWDAWRTNGFTEVEGVIVDRTVTRERTRPGKPRRNKAHFLTLTYEYDVAGETYEGDRVHAGTFGLASGDTLKKYGSRYPVGKTVSVWVDPADPETAVLEKGLSSIALMLYVITGMLGFAVLFVNAMCRPMPAAATPVETPASTT